MSRRFAALILVFLLVGSAEAHRLEAEAQARLVRKIQIESWYETGAAPKAAKVEVFQQDGQLLIEGRLNEAGTFLFYADGQPLRVVVSAGEGHVKEILIPAAEITDTSAALPKADRTRPDWLRDVVIGVGFLLGAGAFALSLWNWRRLRAANQGR